MGTHGEKITGPFLSKWSGYLEDFMGIEVDPFDQEDYLRADNQEQMQREATRIWKKTSEVFKRECIRAGLRTAYGDDAQMAKRDELDWGQVMIRHLFKCLLKQAMQAKFGQEFSAEAWDEWTVHNLVPQSELGGAIRKSLEDRLSQITHWGDL